MSCKPQRRIWQSARLFQSLHQTWYASAGCRWRNRFWPAFNPQPWLLGAGFDADELHDAAGDVPILDVEIAFGVPAGAVGAAEDAFDPLILRHVEILPLLGVGVVAEH